MNQSAINTYSDIAKYIQAFLSLNINEYKGEKAPHKPLLLLSIIQLMEDGVIVENKIPPVQATSLSLIQPSIVSYIKRNRSLITPHYPSSFPTE